MKENREKKNRMSKEWLLRGGKRTTAVLLTCILLSALVLPATFAVPPSFTVGTSGDDTLTGLVYEYSVADSDDSAYDDPGGNDTLRNITFRNMGSGSGAAIFSKASGKETVSGTLRIQNVRVILTEGITLAADGVIEGGGLLSGSSIPISTIEGLGATPRAIVTGISATQAAMFTVDPAYDSYYLNNSLYARMSTGFRVLFDGSGADTEASPNIKVVASPDMTIDALPYPPQKAGNTFLGWNTEKNGSGTAFTEETDVTADITVYAQWAVQAAPTFTKQPASQQKKVGDAVTFSVAATGFPAPALQWQKSSDNSTWVNIDGETGASLTLTNLSLADSDIYYRATASNRVVTGGVNSVAALLTVTDTTTPSLATDPETIDFGSMIDPVSNVQPLTVSVSGENLTGDISYAITGTDSGSFAATEASWTNADGGTLNIAFTPSGVKSYSAALEITGGGAATLSVPITAEVLAAGTPVLQVDRGSVNFGSVLVGTTTSANSVTIGGTNLSGISHQLGGSDPSAFSVSEGAGWTAAVGGQLRITFSPTVARAYSATLTVKNTGAQDLIIQLTGQGIDAPVSPSLTVTPSTVNFGNVYSGDTVTETVAVSGANLASDLEISVTGSDASVFSFNKPTGWDDATGGTLNVTFTPTASGAKSAALVIKTYGVADKTVTLSGTGILSAAPAFETSPQSAIKNVGETATFTVLVSGAPAPTLQWQKSVDGGVTWTDISGATSSSYTMNSVQVSDNGTQLRCTAKNAASLDSVNSTAATLTVTFPNITVDQAALAFDSVGAGKESSLTLAVGGSNLTGNITYSKTGTDASAFMVIETSWNAATGGTLTVKFSPTEVKSYTASIEIASAGASTQTVALTGMGSIILPKFSTHPLSQTKMVGGTATFTAALESGGADATLKWEKSTDKGATWAAVANATTETLTVSNLTTADSDSRYRCVATYTAGSGGTVNSNAATLTVTIDHTMTEKPPTITETGKTAVFKVNGDVSKVTEFKINSQSKALEGAGTTSVKIKDGSTEIGAMTSGSVVVTLNSGYIDSLSNGTYTVEVLFDDGSSAGTFTIARSGSGSGGNGSVNTNDDSNMALWLTLAAVGVSGMAILVVLKLRAKKKSDGQN